MIDLSFKYEKLVKIIEQETPFTPEVAIILGSGLGEFSNSLETKTLIDAEELPGYPVSAVEGHSSQIKFSILNSKKIVIFKGRSHYYEGYKLSECILPVFVTHKLGCKKLILTNAAGGIKQNLLPGDLMLSTSFNAISLKKELTQLIGLASVEIKKSFLNCPSIKLNDIIRKSAEKEGIRLAKEINSMWDSPDGGMEWVDLQLFHGCSEYDTQQMSTLLSGTIEDVKELGIDTDLMKHMLGED